MAKLPPNDTDITAVVAISPMGERMQFQRAQYARRTYYRLVYSEAGKGSGMLTTAAVARQTIAYWRAKGWIVEDADPPS